MAAQVLLALSLGLGATILLLIVLRVGYSAIHPGALMLIAWIGSLLWHAMGLIEFEYTVISANTATLVMVCLTAFTVGSLIRFNIRRGSTEWEPPTQVRMVNQIPRILLVLGTLAYGLCLIPVWQKFASMGFSISEARMELWNNFDSASHTPASALMAVARPAAVFLAVSVPVYWKRDFYMFLVAVGSVVLLFLEDFAIGGRTFTGFAVFGCFFSALSIMEIGDYRVFKATALWRLLRRKQTYFAIFAGAGLIYFCLGVFPVIRNPNMERRLEYFIHMQLGSGTRITPEIEQLSDKLGRPDIKYFAFGSTYLTSSLMRMNYMLNETDASEWYFLGGNNFTIFSKVYNRLTNRQGYSLLDVKRKIKNSQPYSPNPWICGIMDVVIDFGIIGSVIFMFIAGWLCAMNYGCVRRYASQEFIALQSLICIVILSFPYTCRLQSNTFTLTALVALGIAAIRNVRWLPSK